MNGTPDSAPGVYCRLKGALCTNGECLPTTRTTPLPKCETSLMWRVDEALNGVMEEDEARKIFALEAEGPPDEAIKLFNATLATIRDHRKALEDWLNY